MYLVTPEDIEWIYKLRIRVIDETSRALTKFGPFKSAHEGFGVIKEELDELWDEIKANKGNSPKAQEEAIQLAAMALLYALSVSRNFKWTNEGN